MKLLLIIPALAACTCPVVEPDQAVRKDSAPFYLGGACHAPVVPFGGGGAREILTARQRPSVAQKATTEPKDQPPSEPPADEATGKSDNSDANGKGGNKHNRRDKDKPAQEIAEEKKP